VGIRAGDGRNAFFAGMAVAAATIVFAGFAPTFYLRSTFNPGAELSMLLHVHGFALSAWIVLFLFQTLLITGHQPILHRRLGWVMVALAGLIVLLMGAAIVEQLRRVPPTPPAPFALAFGMFDIIVFATLVSSAIYWRKRSDWHKRLMMSATVLLVTAASVRIAAFQGFHEPRDLMLAQYCSILLFFLMCFGYDLAVRRRIHPATVLGFALIISDQAIQPILLSWSGWTDFANALQRLVA
jgi:hypothetical protein